MSRTAIVILNFNGEKLLPQFLPSVIQHSDKAEIIVADNDSRDNTYEHVNASAKCFPTTMRALKVPRPGKSAAVNDAVHAASGNILAFLDGKPQFVVTPTV